MITGILSNTSQGVMKSPQLLQTGSKLANNANRPTIPNPNDPDPMQQQKPDKFDAFHAFASEQMADAGFRKSGADKKAGFVAQSGRFKGLTQDEIQGQLRREFGGLNQNQRSRYQRMAQGEDIAAGGGVGRDVVERPNLLAEEEAGANRLLTEAGNVLASEKRLGELGNLDQGVRTGSIGGKPEPELTPVKRPDYGPNFMTEMQETGRAVLGGNQPPNNLPKGIYATPSDPNRIPRKDLDLGSEVLVNNKPIRKGNLG